MILPFRGTGFASFIIGALLVCACSSARPAPVPQVAFAAPVPPAEKKAPQAFSGRVLLLNGGGNPNINYQSHLLHIETLRTLLIDAGIPARGISVLASDGSDPAPDLTTREIQPEPEFWRLSGTRLQRWLKTPLVTVDSRLPNVTLQAATKENLTRWFDDASVELGAGDTLLVYVTDHGTRHGPDPLDNRITLWESGWISVREFAALVSKLDPSVRVVMLMSQCFSGGFSELTSLRTRDGEPTGNVCGYFSSTADRPAYGCYPENFGKDTVGHAFEFFGALSRTTRFHDAHEAVLVNDATPDVPLRTSDAYLESLLSKDAAARGVSLEARTDELLREAFRDASIWQRETRLLDRIAQATGSFSPRSLAELEELSQRLAALDEQLKLVEQAWQNALADANSSNLERFIALEPEWAARLSEPALGALLPAAARTVTPSLLADITAFTARDAALEWRLTTLRNRGVDARAASYRMQVRLAVVLRMRNILISIAARKQLATAGTPAQTAAFERLLACEQLSFPELAASAAVVSTEHGRPHSYPPFDQDVTLTQRALPGWMGIRFQDPRSDLGGSQPLPPGSSMVALVYPNSPALTAGLEVGDIVLGPPGDPFTSRNQIRAWTMLSEIGKPAELEILRDGQRQRISIVPDAFPVKMPALPEPVQVGSTAPVVRLQSYRGVVSENVRKNRKHLLYFWATWCGPCKAALPELLAFEKQHKAAVIAVTDEESRVLDSFSKTSKLALPRAIARDPLRRAFVAMGVSGTPTFILVDETGTVIWRQVGYTGAQGLTIPGWTWSERR